MKTVLDKIMEMAISANSSTPLLLTKQIEEVKPLIIKAIEEKAKELNYNFTLNSKHEDYPEGLYFAVYHGTIKPTVLKFLNDYDGGKYKQAWFKPMYMDAKTQKEFMDK